MKRNVPGHPKVSALMWELSISRTHAVGLLEMMWHYTQTYTPQGDIAKHGTAAVATAVDWEGSEGDLVEGLISTGWLDRLDDGAGPDGEGTIVVHDWAEHCDQTTVRYLKRAKKEFIGSSRPTAPRHGAVEGSSPEDGQVTSHIPDLARPPSPSPSPEPSPPPSPDAAAGGGGGGGARLGRVQKRDLEDPEWLSEVAERFHVEQSLVHDLARAVLNAKGVRSVGAVFARRFQSEAWATDEELQPTPEELRVAARARDRERAKEEARKRAEDPPLPPEEIAALARRARDAMGPTEGPRSPRELRVTGARSKRSRKPKDAGQPARIAEAG